MPKKFKISRPSPAGPNTKGGFVRSEEIQKMHQWAEANFTDPRTIPISARKPIQGPFIFLVHTIPTEVLKGTYSQLFSGDPASIFAGYDNVSASVISDKHARTFGPVGVVLGVPPQNILLTNCSDIGFPNNIGRLDRAEFAERSGWPAMQSMPPYLRYAPFVEEVYAHHKEQRILTPRELLGMTHPSDYNEVLIVTRSGVNIHPGHPATGPLKIKAIFRLFGVNDRKMPESRRVKEDSDLLAEIERMVGTRWPVIEIDSTWRSW